MEVILKRDVENLGSAGEVVDVKRGYARNYLIPQGLAMRASEGAVRRLEEERLHLERAADREREQAEEVAEKLDGRSFTFTVHAGEEGRLFGSVTAMDVGELLEREGFEVDRRLIQLDEPIKELGVYQIPVRLHPDVRPEIKVWVVAQK